MTPAWLSAAYDKALNAVLDPDMSPVMLDDMASDAERLACFLRTQASFRRSQAPVET